MLIEAIDLVLLALVVSYTKEEIKINVILLLPSNNQAR